MAQFLEDSAGVFRNIGACLIPNIEPQMDADGGREPAGWRVRCGRPCGLADGCRGGAGRMGRLCRQGTGATIVVTPHPVSLMFWNILRQEVVERRRLELPAPTLRTWLFVGIPCQY